ncbi:hypothetical protein E3P86_00862 [Wallemia ichthyophaga]|uniref:U1-type domain-containing protein n=1 Tax=Wallemia ichthyophaga TaxID=245174 RepID=A0A4T0JCC4_WALIC|nr:hypothetical protein E3P86_00862 [Wallemia ichthyophaga]
MADYWKSTPKYHCKYCDITINDDAPSRSQHENGLKHKGNKDRFIRSIYKRSEQNERDRAFEERELRRLEGIGGAASAKETATGLKTPGNKTTSSRKAQASRDPYANYTTAKSLGYEEAGMTQEPRGVQIGLEGSVGGWEEVPSIPNAVANEKNKRGNSSPPPPPHEKSDQGEMDLNATKTASSGEIYIPGKTNTQNTTEVSLLMTTKMEEGNDINYINVPFYQPNKGTLNTSLTILVEILFNSQSQPSTKQLRVVFGNVAVATKVKQLDYKDLYDLGLNPANVNGNLCVIAQAPPLEHTQWLSHRVPLILQALDNSTITDSIEFGYFDYLSNPSNSNYKSFISPPQFHDDNPQSSTSYQPFSLPQSPYQPSPQHPVKIEQPLSPTLAQTKSPALAQPTQPIPQSIQQSQSIQQIRQPPPPTTAPMPPPVAPPIPTGAMQEPPLVRTSQLPTGPSGESLSPEANRATLVFHGNLLDMASSWTQEEWENRRRLVQFWRRQEGPVVHATFRPITQAEYNQDSVVISCIFREDKNECFVTSVDAIYLLEALVGIRFTVEEKNRIRRNLEGFKPITVSKTKAESEAFFKLIMSFPNPKPRNIEKDVKVFPWSILSEALKKIISKYSADYNNELGAIQHQQLESPASQHSHNQSFDQMSPSSARQFDFSQFVKPEEEDDENSYSQPPHAAYLNSLREEPTTSPPSVPNIPQGGVGGSVGDLGGIVGNSGGVGAGPSSWVYK